MFFKKDSGGVSWLLVCLGNPGDKYENTRHNVGFMVADEVAERQRKPIQRLKFKALTNVLTISGEKVLVMKPITYMNLSGEEHHPTPGHRPVPPPAGGGGREAPPRLRYGRLGTGKIRWGGQKGHRRRRQTGCRRHRVHPGPGHRPGDGEI